ncbi:MAG: S-methyl-5'-thioadenosine phosphorylase, partial [Thermodesulfobacteriota bacterium]
MRIGIIGGSGLDDPHILENPTDLEMDTPFGPPNSTLRVGKIAGREVALLARHGRQHTAPPTH